MGWLVFSNVYVALCGAALTAATYPLLGLPPRIDAPVLMVFCATLVVYNLDRLVEPTPGDTPHERWVARHRGALWVLTVLAAAGCDVIAWGFLSPAARWSLVLPGLVALGYCVPVLPRGPGVGNAHGAPGVPGAPRWRRLKEVPGAKLLLIGVVWAYATAVLPALHTGTDVATPAFAVVLAGRLLFILAVALPFDVPDMARDREAGIVTLPQALGIGGARRVALLLAAGFMAFASLHTWPAAAAQLVAGGVTLAQLVRMDARRGVWYYEVGLDGLLLVHAALILAVTL